MALLTAVVWLAKSHRSPAARRAPSRYRRLAWRQCPTCRESEPGEARMLNHRLPSSRGNLTAATNGEFTSRFARCASAPGLRALRAAVAALLVAGSVTAHAGSALGAT